MAYNASNNRQTGDTADANGNIGSGYLYDIDNRLVQPVASGSVAYGYDTGNKRVWRGDTGSGLDEIAFWAGQKLATYQVSSDGSGTYFALTSTNVYFGGKLISKGAYNSLFTGDKVALAPVVADRQGSIKKFYPYGTERPSATANDTEKFTGYYRDASTGLDYADQRYHQPGMGRFLTADPKAGSAHANDPGSWNRYAYVNGDPVNSKDPTGLDPYDPFDPNNPLPGGYIFSGDFGSEDQGVGYVLPSEVYQEGLGAYSSFGGCPSDPSVLLNTFLSSNNYYYEGAYDACTRFVPAAQAVDPDKCHVEIRYSQIAFSGISTDYYHTMLVGINDTTGAMLGVIDGYPVFGQLGDDANNVGFLLTPDVTSNGHYGNANTATPYVSTLSSASMCDRWTNLKGSMTSFPAAQYGGYTSNSNSLTSYLWDQLGQRPVAGPPVDAPGWNESIWWLQ